MADNTQAPQNFQNHTRTDPKIVAVSVAYLLALILAVVGLIGPAWATQAALFATIIGATLMSLTSRAYSTGLQDRIIRLEMRLRLERILTDDLKGRIDDLTLSQLIGLRFASDAELPALMRRALDEKLPSKELKKAVTDWQADHHRV